MKIDILTLFPEMFSSLHCALLGKAIDNGVVEINAVDIREFSANKHKKCDDYPFGGGAGMVMSAQPIHDAMMSVDPDHKALRIFMSPRGETLSQSRVENLATLEHIVILCGHYEGVDQRVIDMHIDLDVSIGDYVLSGGEIPAMVLVDAVSRYIPTVLGNSETTSDESFANGMLEYPQYTRPQQFMGINVPEVLTSGNHANIDKWRKEQSKIITQSRRPDLLNKE